MKKKIKIIISAIGILAFFGLCFIAVNYNNFRLNKFAEQLYDMELPADINVIETEKICGKLSGNGNSMDYLACLLVRTNRSKAELLDFLDSKNFDSVESDGNLCVEKEVVKVDDDLLQSKFLQHQTVKFESLSSETDFRNYYAIIIYDGGYSSDFDIRGH